jgi:hypothetical protein
MLSTISKLPESKRLQGLASLAVLFGLVLSPLLQGCTRSSPGNGSNPDWLAFTVDTERMPVPGPAVTVAGSIQEMERIGGFSFVFPSYLPGGLGKDIRLGALAPSTSDSIPEETVQLESEREETPSIFISESLCDPACVVLGLITHKIGDTDVACSVSSMGNWLQELECHWTTEDKIITVVFGWQQIDATPTHDMRQEGMKVVESMILSPTHP